MNRLFILIMLFCPLLLMGQEPESVTSSDVGGIYYNQTRVGYSRITGQRVGNLAGAYFSFGLSGAKRTLQIEGKTATLKITDELPQFKIVFSNNEKSDEVFKSSDMLNYLVLVKLKTGKNERKLQNGSYGLTGVESSVSKKYIIPLSIEKVGEATYSIIPKEKLSKGEYGFYFNIPKSKNEGEKDNSFNGIFDFSISK